jgi:uncharacterized protein DUF3768
LGGFWWAVPGSKPEQEANRIAALNDRFRSRCGMMAVAEDVPGGFVFTQGINSLPPERKYRSGLPCAISATSPKGKIPMQNAIFGAFTIDDVPEKIFWKISYYADASCSGGAEDPSDPARCFRILTIMLASEY